MMGCGAASVLLLDTDGWAGGPMGAAESSEIEVPNSADDRLESSTTTRAKLGNDETLDDDVPSAIWARSGFVEACLSERRNGEREKLGSRRKVLEPGIEVRCRPVRQRVCEGLGRAGAGLGGCGRRLGWEVCAVRVARPSVYPSLESWLAGWFGWLAGWLRGR